MDFCFENSIKFDLILALKKVAYSAAPQNTFFNSINALTLRKPSLKFPKILGNTEKTDLNTARHE